MIKVTVGDALNHKEVIVTPDTTPRSIFTQNGYNAFEAGVIYLNSNTLAPSKLDQPIGNLTVTDTCTLISVIKRNNA